MRALAYYRLASPQVFTGAVPFNNSLPAVAMSIMCGRRPSRPTHQNFRLVEIDVTVLGSGPPFAPRCFRGVEGFVRPVSPLLLAIMQWLTSLFSCG